MSALRIILLALSVASLYGIHVRLHFHAAPAQVAYTTLSCLGHDDATLANTAKQPAQAVANVSTPVIPQHDDEIVLLGTLGNAVGICAGQRCAPLHTSECYRHSIHKLSTHSHWDYLTLGVLIT